MQRPGGVYLYGTVGVGKTTVVDLFFASASAAHSLHYDELVHMLHRELHKHRQKKGAKCKTGMEWIRYLARKMARGKLMGPVSFLVVDEMQLPTVQDCTLVIPFLAELRAAGCSLVATSNKPPSELFQGHGLYPALRVQLQQLLDGFETCEVMGVDYRVEAGRSAPADPPLFLEEGDSNNRRNFLKSWTERLQGPEDLTHEPIQLSFGRQMKSIAGRVIVLDFENDVAAFNTALSAADFHTIAKHADAVLIDNVPVFSRNSADSARRLTLLVEALYEQRAALVSCFQAPLADTFGIFMGRKMAPLCNFGIQGNHTVEHLPEGTFIRRSCSEHRCGGCTWSSFGGKRCGVIETEDWALLEMRFATERTLSRLSEMSSDSYFSASKAAKHLKL